MTEIVYKPPQEYNEVYKTITTSKFDFVPATVYDETNQKNAGRQALITKEASSILELSDYRITSDNNIFDLTVSPNSWNITVEADAVIEEINIFFNSSNNGRLFIMWLEYNGVIIYTHYDLTGVGIGSHIVPFISGLTERKGGVYTLTLVDIDFFPCTAADFTIYRSVRYA